MNTSDGRAVPATVCRWAVAGCGWVARDHFLPGLLAAAGSRAGGAVPRLVAVTDADPAAAARLAARVPGARTATDLPALLAVHRPDAVYVATPNHAHRPAVTAAAAAGAAVLCEKPLAAGLADAERLVAACHRAGVLAATAYDQRFHPAHRAVREVTASGALGTITAVRITYCCWLPPTWSPDGRPYDNWRADPARAGGGAALDLAPHGLDLVGVLLGGDDVTELTALVQHRVHPYPVDDGAVLAGRTGGGVLVCLHVAYNTPDTLPRRRLEVVGTRGQLTAVDTLGQDAGGRLWLTDAHTTRRVPVPFDTGTSPFAAQVREFSAAAVSAGRPVGRAWPWPLHRDLALHRLLLEALSPARPAPQPPVPSTVEEGRR
ncbi:Gfo/Idh/MocA family oxidoreductase [Streptomyces sp. MA15]|uniref:Gfo/Idh/MocA family protein n=1 Tax=Streptomyces sp. MA15 TaxID=3055061 RepID=UPI0025B19EAF|nr:Gfo/Idh/MocA family oxidoreductase [Streptomyces sp. MA15]MDN3267126.1 Gfo/Idh/MocA family oxidoreductase [Streptomyces sp. MA15]